MSLAAGSDSAGPASKGFAMSAVPSAPEFEHLIRALTSRDNSTRQGAEAIYAGLKDSPDALGQHLIRALRQSPQEDVRAMCAIMLRRVSQWRPHDSAACFSDRAASDSEGPAQCHSTNSSPGYSLHV